jgi:hypothetical protein
MFEPERVQRALILMYFLYFPSLQARFRILTNGSPLSLHAHPFRSGGGVHSHLYPCTELNPRRYSRLSKGDELLLRKEIVKTIALLYQKGLVTPTGGNVSARLPGSGRFWITPSGLFKGELKAGDVVEVGLKAKASLTRLKPSIETPLHSKIYATRDDVHAIIHAHSPVTLGTALAGIEITPLTP